MSKSKVHVSEPTARRETFTHAAAAAERDAAEGEFADPMNQTRSWDVAEVLALVEQERRIAGTNQSGVRAVAPVIVGLRDPQVTKPDNSDAVQVEVATVHRAEADELRALAQEEMVAPQPPAPSLAEPTAPSRAHPRFPAAEPMPPGWGEPRLVLVPSEPRESLAPVRRKSGVRRFFAVLLFVVVMAGALAVLAAALHQRGLVRLPEWAAREVERLQHRAW